MADFQETEVKTPHSISIEEFLNPHVPRPTQFEWKGQITRSNFTDWYEESFKISLGQPRAQYLFFAWCKENLNFDFEGTLNNFFEARGRNGNWNFLSPEEQKTFGDRYKNIGRHREVNKKYDIDTDALIPLEVLDKAEGQIRGIQRMVDVYRRAKTIIMPMLPEIPGMSSEVFKEKIKEEVVKMRREKDIKL